MNHATQPPWTRRAFLHTGLTLASSAATLPLFLQHAATAIAAQPGAVGAKPGVPEDRILVVVQLSGGNDGLNTVVPYGMDDYYRLRPSLAINADEALPLDTDRGIGLHPRLAPVRELVEAGRAAIVQGVGYPNPNRSHFVSMDIWHTADPGGGRGVGWLGKALDARPNPQIDATACVCLGREAPLAAQGRRTKPIAFENAELFQWSGKSLHPALASAYDAINRDAPSPDANTPADDSLAFVMRTSLDAQIASDRIRAAVQRGPVTRFAPGELASQLQQVAAMIRAELPTRVYYVELGGFDTHAAQPGRHANLMREFAQAIHAFDRELHAIGQRSRVLTLAFSEFGRRIAQNGSNGTDHGTAGPMMLFGESVRPGLLGEHPSLTTTDDGDLLHNVDFRSVYAGVLERWMGVDSAPVLGKPFPPAQILKV